MTSKNPSKACGFTLIELLVVIGIVGIIAALTLPAIQYTRVTAGKMHCQSNLRQVGLALFMYMDARGQKSKFPDCAQMPSLTPDRPSIVATLGKYAEENKQMFQCPADTVYFEKEGVSYEYPSSLLYDKNRQQLLTSGRGQRRSGGSSTRLAIMWDYDSFHRGDYGIPLVWSADDSTTNSGGPGTRNFLFLDGHVDNLLPGEE